MKIAINRRYGGFQLSDEAMRLFAEKKGMIIKKRGDFFYIEEDGHYFNDYLFSRSDPDLISVIEELGEKANTEYSTLGVVEIPDDVNWYIEEYDGWESVHEVHRSWE